jgi:hypothetical protein
MSFLFKNRVKMLLTCAGQIPVHFLLRKLLIQKGKILHCKKLADLDLIEFTPQVYNVVTLLVGIFPSNYGVLIQVGITS